MNPDPDLSQFSEDQDYEHAPPREVGLNMEETQGWKLVIGDLRRTDHLESNVAIFPCSTNDQ